MNVQAKNLYHDLNATKDTLVLRSDANINYVYSINKNVKRELSYTVNDKSLNVPLDKLSDGRHVFVVVQSPMRIVFVVNVTREYDEDLASAELELVSSDNR